MGDRFGDEGSVREALDELRARVEQRVGERLRDGSMSRLGAKLGWDPGRGAGDGARGRGGSGSSRASGSGAGRDLRLAVLVLLRERAMHGYELIGAIEERSAGAWAPGAAAVYPLLRALAEEGLVVAEQVDGRAVYTLTDAGRVAADTVEGAESLWRSSSLGADPGSSGSGASGVFGDEESGDSGADGDGGGGAGYLRGRELAKAGIALAQAAAEVGRSGSAAQVQQAVDELVAVRKRLYGILAQE